MDKIFYMPSKFVCKGERFDTPSGMGGSFTIELIGKRPDGKFAFYRPAKTDWPADTYVFTEEQLSSQVYRVIPGKYERLVFKDETRKKYEEMLADRDVDRVENY